MAKTMPVAAVEQRGRKLVPREMEGPSQGRAQTLVPARDACPTDLHAAASL